MALNLAALLIQIVVSVIIISPILWLVGRAMVGGQKAKFTDAIWIVALGIIINRVLGMFIGDVIGIIANVIVWLALIRHFFDTGWIKALLITIVSIIVLKIVQYVLAALGYNVPIGFLGF